MLRLLGILLVPILWAGSVRTLTVLPKVYVAATAMDRSGAIYLTGYIESPDLPASPGAFQSQYHATMCQGPQFPFPCPDAFVVKIDATGRLIYATYLGGDQYDVATAITVDTSGNAYVAGFTTSSDFPLTANSLPDDSLADGFVTKLNPSGSALVYSTRLPGFSGSSAIAVDGSGQAHIAGSVRGPGLPVTSGAIQTELRVAAGYGSAAVLKLGSRGDQVLFATYLGGSREDSISDLTLDAQGNVYVTGSTTSSDFPFTSGSLDTRPPDKDGFADAFVAKLNPAGTQLLYAARPSGSCNDRPAAIVVDPGGRAFLTGWTCSSDYPITGGALQSAIGLMPSMAFVTVLSADGSSLEYSTYFGGSQSSAGTSIALDSQSRIVVSGSTNDPDFPTSPGAPQRCNSAPDLYQGFLVRLDPVNPAAKFASYLDVHGTAIPEANVGDGGILVAGRGPDGSRIVEVDSARPTDLSLQCVANSANGWSAAVAPGELVTLYGTGLGPAQSIAGTPDSSGVIGKELAGTRILFDGVPAPVLAASEDELRAVVPFELAGRSTVRVQVQRGVNQTEPLDLAMADVVPGIFRIDTTNRVAVLNEDGTENSAENPAKRGSIITFWATGLGTMEPAVGDGAVASNESLSKIVAPLRVGFFGWPAEVLYAGSAPGLVAGVVQINVRVPEQMGPFSYPVDLIIISGGPYIPVRVTVDIK
jgi:uncharacterized protein (TIGR03437 family)